MQGLAAGSMPACPHMAAMLQTQHIEEMSMSNMKMLTEQDMAIDMTACEQHHSPESAPQHSSDCHKCYFCLMSAIVWLVPEIPNISIAKTHNTLHSFQTVLLNQTTNSPPYHPPKTLAA